VSGTAEPVNPRRPTVGVADECAPSVRDDRAWAGRLKAMPGFALAYQLIPSKDHEYDSI
jgi:hypothetical protein